MFVTNENILLKYNNHLSRYLTIVWYGWTARFLAIATFTPHLQLIVVMFYQTLQLSCENENSLVIKVFTFVSVA